MQHCCDGAPVVVFVIPVTFPSSLRLVDASMDAPGLSLVCSKSSLSPSKQYRNTFFSAPSSSPFAILVKKVVVALLGMCFAADGKSEISAAAKTAAPS